MSELKAKKAVDVAARIAELEAELVELKAPPFQEYPKYLRAEGRIVSGPEEEKAVLAAAKKGK